MKTLSPHVFKLPLAVLGSLALLAGFAQAATVGPAGYTNSFATQPAASDWATLNRVGGGADAYDMDADVNANVSAATVVTAITAAAADPAAAAATASWSSTGFYLQLRPTGNRYTVLMGKFVNNTGTNATQVNISYLLTIAGASANEEAGKGTRVYYSLSGELNSWSNLPTLNQTLSVATPAQAVSTNLMVNWTNGGSLYLVWADDNANIGTDLANEIDNFSLGITAGSPLTLSVALTSPANNAVLVTGTPLNAEAAVSSGTAPFSVQYFLSSGAGSTTFTPAGSSATAPYTTSLGNLSPGTYNLYAVVMDSAGTPASATSFTNTFYVADPLAVSLASPANDASFDNTTSVIGSANVTGGTAPFSVQFFLDDQPAGSALVTVPFTYNFGPLFVGNHNIRATVVDSKGWSNSSSVATVHITGPLGVALSPANGSSFSYGQPLVLNADVGGGNPPYSVLFYVDGNAVGAAVTTAPFTANAGLLPVGEHTIYAAAADSSSAIPTAFSTTNDITILPNPLVATLTSPTNGQRGIVGQAFALAADASVTSPVTVASVEFFFDGASAGVDSTAPFSASVSGVGEGVHTTYALATDSLGRKAYTVTNAMNFVVDPLANDHFTNRFTLTTPASVTGSNNGATTETGEPTGNFFPRWGASLWYKWTAPVSGPAVVDTFGSDFNTMLTVFRGAAVSALIQVAQNDNAPGFTDVSRMTFNAVQGTEYQIQLAGVQGFGQGGFLPPATGSFRLNLTMPPVVAITSPTNNSVFTVGSNIFLTATATSAVGTVTKVDFYRRDVLLGTATAEPYSVLYTNSLAGTNSITAVVTDSAGQISTSAVVNVAFLLNGITLVRPADGEVFTNSSAITVAALPRLASGSITNVQFFVDGLKFAEDSTVPFSVSWTNVSAGSHRLTATARSDSGQFFQSQPVTIGVAAALVQRGSSWHYLDDGTDQGTGWVSPSFDDSEWKTGFAEFGYGDGDERTEILSGPVGNFFITTYYRKTFAVSNLSSYTSILLNLKRDDGAVVYLNGVEVVRSSMPAGPVNYLTLALNAADDGMNFNPFIIPAASFVEGLNTLAVEIHQTTADSSDTSFDLELIGFPKIIRNNSPEVAITSPSEGSSFLGSPSVTIQVSAIDTDGTVTNVIFYANGTMLGQDNTEPYSLTWNNPPIGSYELTAVAYDAMGAFGNSLPVRVNIYDAAGNPFTSITSPTNNTVVEGPTNMLVTATASALDSVARVEFFANGASLGSDASAPYSIVWTAPFGNSVLTTVAYGADGKSGTSAPVNVTITIPPTNTVPPTIVAEIPAAGSIVSSLSSIQVTFSERVQGVDASDMLINGVPATGLTGGGSNYVFTFSPPAYGEVFITWAVDHGITDFGWPTNLPFYELDPGGRWEYELVDRSPPFILVRFPAANSTVTNLTNVYVTFSEPVVGVDAADLLVNGVPALSVMTNGNQFVFTVAQPPSGTVNVSWASSPGIVDLTAGSPNPFVESAAAARWSFNLDARYIFVQTNSSWRLLKGLAQPSTPPDAWRQPLFNDSTWSNSFAPFFYGDPYSNGVPSFTLLSDMVSNYTTIYLRKPFVVPNRTAVTNLLLSAQSDDGFVAYINGVQVLRVNVPAGELSHTNTANGPSAEPQNNGAGYITYNITNVAPLLFNGTNILAIHALNEALTSSDFGFNAQLYAYLSDAAVSPPRLFLADPAPGEIFYLTNLTITFSEPVSGVDGADLLVNGVPAIGVSSTTNTTYTFTFAQPVYGSVVVTWAASHGIVDFDNTPRAFNAAAPGATLRFTLLNPSAPLVAGKDPLAGSTITSLTSLTVTFSEPVQGVNASDLLVNGAPANTVTPVNASTYTFGVSQPPYGAVTIGWAATHGITDLEPGANAFDPTRPGGTWSYNLVDPVPSVAITSPTNHNYFMVGLPITLRANASDNDGSVALVEYFDNTVKIGDAVNAPYTFDWSTAGLGAHVLRAVVTDNSGLSRTSSPVMITVVTNTPATLTRGPYLQVGTPTSGIIRWRTDILSDSVVRYGANPSTLTGRVAKDVLTNEHIVQITGLLPDTKYYYSIERADQILAAGEEFWFKTSPLPGTRSKPIRFWVLGDSGTASQNQVAVRESYEIYAKTNAPSDLWLMLGDNAYNSGLDTEYQRAVFDMYPDTLRNLFLWPTIGNHESAQSFTAVSFPYLNIFTLPQNAEAGGVPSGSSKYYSFDYGNIHFVSLDSMTSGRSTNTAMVQWLINDLAATAQEWIVVFFHHPPYTKGSHNSDTEAELIEIRQNINPILEANGVDLVLSGHSHCYERSFLLHGHYGNSTTLTPDMKLDAGDGRLDGTGFYQKDQNGHGLVYTVAGSSGQATGGSLNHPAHFVSLNELGSMVIEVSSNRLHAVFLSTNGLTRDNFTLIKPNYAPVANDAIVALDEDTPTQVLLPATGGNGQLAYHILSAPLHGVATYIPAGSLVPQAITNGSVLAGISSILYTPVPDYFGADSLTFKVSDGTRESASATVSITVRPLNDAPVADASATPQHTIVSLNNINATAVLDGSQSYDVDLDPLEFLWTDGLTPIASNVISLVTLPVGPHSISLVVSDGYLSSTNSFLMEVVTGGQGIQRLMEMVNAGAAVPKPLLASLEAARDAFNRGNFTAGMNQLQAFQNKVRAQLLSKNPALANELLAIAQGLIDAFSGNQERPKLAMTGGRGAKVKFSANAAKAYVVEVSTDLIHWRQVGTARHTGNGDFEFETPETGASTRFYRVVSP